MDTGKMLYLQIAFILTVSWVLPAALFRSTTPSPLLGGVCSDHSITGESCQHLASLGFCWDKQGVEMCPQTCGFCTYLKFDLGGLMFCKDRLINNECNTTVDICKNMYTRQMCPLKCSACGVVLGELIAKYLEKTKAAHQ